MTITDGARDLVTMTPVRLAADSSRVMATLHLPGEDMPGDRSRAAAVVERVSALDDEQVRATLAELTVGLSGHLRRLDDTFERHFEYVARLASIASPLSRDRHLLIGAYATAELSPESSALTNPSMVEHPDQSGLTPGELRFVMSVRAVGSGGLSSIGFRTGVISADQTIRIDDLGKLLDSGQPSSPLYERAIFRAQLREGDFDDWTIDLALEGLETRFTRADLTRVLTGLGERKYSRSAPSYQHRVRAIVRQIEWVAANNYQVVFPEDTAISDRVLIATGPTETHGMEDARFVRFVDHGAVSYYATYTAYDGNHVAPQLLETVDFRTFRVRQLSGPSAKNKGMALFPRRVGGQYLSLSRWDRETTSLAASQDRWAWGQPTAISSPHQPWELIKVGNCGSPIETPRGWLVFTHGVGPMWTTAIGALLLDLEDPRRVVAALQTPLVVPKGDESDGHVPNMVYSCGALLHGDTVVLPYGFGEQAIGIALIDLPELLHRLLISAK
jgi:predicted GH43/DUF377 family glycosyl hydrolase